MVAKITSKDELIDYTLRRLGEPVIEVNVDRKQCEERLDDTLQFFEERHFDGIERALFSYEVKQEDIDNKYINTDSLGPVNGPEGDGPTGKDVLTVTRIFQFGDFANINMFDVRYQMALVDYFGINRGLNANLSMGLANYDATKRHIGFIEDLFQPEKQIRFNKVTNRLHLDMNWAVDATAGEYVIIEAYVSLNPDIFVEIYNDRMLKEYFTALVKKQWGINMSKFDGVQLPGGVTLKGSQILAEAAQEIRDIEARYMSDYELPVDFTVG